jgi:hypothetical protein
MIMMCSAVSQFYCILYCGDLLDFIQAESDDVGPTEHSEDLRGVICKSTFANHLS